MAVAIPGSGSICTRNGPSAVPHDEK
jgi:hypothetical protein